jgi:ribosomal protein L24E
MKLIGKDYLSIQIMKAVKLLIENPDKINWGQLSRNEHKKNQ